MANQQFPIYKHRVYLVNQHAKWKKNLLTNGDNTVSVLNPSAGLWLLNGVVTPVHKLWSWPLESFATRVFLKTFYVLLAIQLESLCPSKEDNCITVLPYAYIATYIFHVIQPDCKFRMILEDPLTWWLKRKFSSTVLNISVISTIRVFSNELYGRSKSL